MLKEVSGNYRLDKSNNIILYRSYLSYKCVLRLVTPTLWSERKVSEAPKVYFNAMTPTLRPIPSLSCYL